MESCSLITLPDGSRRALFYRNVSGELCEARSSAKVGGEQAGREVRRRTCSESLGCGEPQKKMASSSPQMASLSSFARALSLRAKITRDRYGNRVPLDGGEKKVFCRRSPSELRFHNCSPRCYWEFRALLSSGRSSRRGSAVSALLLVSGLAICVISIRKLIHTLHRSQLARCPSG